MSEEKEPVVYLSEVQLYGLLVDKTAKEGNMTRREAVEKIRAERNADREDHEPRVYSDKPRPVGIPVTPDVFMSNGFGIERTEEEKIESHQFNRLSHMLETERKAFLRREVDCIKGDLDSAFFMYAPKYLSHDMDYLLFLKSWYASQLDEVLKLEVALLAAMRSGHDEGLLSIKVPATNVTRARMRSNALKYRPLSIVFSQYAWLKNGDQGRGLGETGHGAQRTHAKA